MPFTGMEAMGGAGVAGGTGGGFDWGSLMSNPMVLQMMATLGAGMDPQGPAGAIGGTANQWIQNKSYLEMMKKMLGGGAKFTYDGESGKFGITGKGSALGGGESNSILSSSYPNMSSDPNKFWNSKSGV